MTKLEQVARASDPLLWANIDIYAEKWGTQGGWERPIRESFEQTRAAIIALKFPSEDETILFDHRQIFNEILDKVLEGKL